MLLWNTLATLLWNLFADLLVCLVTNLLWNRAAFAGITFCTSALLLLFTEETVNEQTNTSLSVVMSMMTNSLISCVTGLLWLTTAALF